MPHTKAEKRHYTFTKAKRTAELGKSLGVYDENSKETKQIHRLHKKGFGCNCSLCKPGKVFKQKSFTDLKEDDIIKSQLEEIE